MAEGTQVMVMAKHTQVMKRICPLFLFVITRVAMRPWEQPQNGSLIQVQPHLWATIGKTFISLGKYREKETVSFCDEYETKVIGIGNIRSSIELDGVFWTIQLKEVLHIPGLMCSLLSVSKLRKSSLQALFDPGRKCKRYCNSISKKMNGSTILRWTELEGGLYEITMRIENGIKAKSLLTTTPSYNY